MKKVYVVMEENCDTTEPFIDDGYAKIILTTLDKEKAKKRYQELREEKALEMFDTVEEFNYTLDEEENGNYHNECSTTSRSQLIIVQDYTYYIIPLEERDLE